MAVISCQLFSCQILVVSYKILLTLSVIGDIRLLLHLIVHIILFVNKIHHNSRKRGNCLIMHVVHFGRICYGIPSCWFHHREPIVYWVPSYSVVSY